jgi:hypothetical protein
MFERSTVKLLWHSFIIIILVNTFVTIQSDAYLGSTFIFLLSSLERPVYPTSYFGSVAILSRESFLCFKSVLGALRDVKSGDSSTSPMIPLLDADVRACSALGMRRSSIDESITSSSLLIRA